MGGHQVPWARVVLLALLLAAGCRDSAPKTHPVKGKVVLKGQGGILRQLEGGKVQFQSTSDPNVMATGIIEEDGTFSLDTLLNEKAVAGVPAGEYKARVVPPPDDEGQPQPRLIHPKYQDFDRSGLRFTVPVDGEIVIEVERFRR